MSDIDVTTGLPTPPEGMFWRVEEDRYSNDDGSHSVDVKLMRRVKMRSSEYPVARERVFLWFTRPVKMAEDYYEEERTVYTWPVQYPDIHDQANPHGYVGDMDLRLVTPADILRTAELIMERYRLEVAARKLLGDYPPKTLPEIKENTNG